MLWPALHNMRWADLISSGASQLFGEVHLSWDTPTSLFSCNLCPYMDAGLANPCPLFVTRVCMQDTHQKEGECQCKKCQGQTVYMHFLLQLLNGSSRHTEALLMFDRFMPDQSPVALCLQEFEFHLFYRSENEDKISSWIKNALGINSDYEWPTLIAHHPTQRSDIIWENLH